MLNKYDYKIETKYESFYMMDQNILIMEIKNIVNKYIFYDRIIKKRVHIIFIYARIYKL